MSQASENNQNHSYTNGINNIALKNDMKMEHTVTEKTTKTDDVIKEFPYGCCGTKSRCLQALNKAGWLLFFMCMANIFQSMVVNGLIGTILSSLETRFGFTSSQSSWVVSSYDVSTIPMLIVISYFGSRSHRVRWTALGLLVIVIGSVIMVLPHFVSDEYRPLSSGQDMELCRSKENDTRLCNDQNLGEGDKGYLAVFILARLFYGFGAVPLYTICVTFLDDCVSKETFSLYIAIFYASGVLGPALGFIMGGYLLTFFTDFTTIDPEKELGLRSSDPLWVGAWWPGFLVGAVGLIIVALPMLGYNRDLPGAAEIRAGKISEAYNEKKDEEDEDAGVNEIQVSWRELPAYFKALFTNPTYVFLTLFVCADSLLIGGFTAFGPKYVELQFSISAAFAGILFGIVVVPGGAGGTVFGGAITKKLKLTCSSIMKYEAIFTVCILLLAFMFFIICEPIAFAGVNSGYNQTFPLQESGNFTAECNAPCFCEDYVSFTPVCGDNNVQYFSPCHAGCNSSNEDKTEYYNCSCLDFGIVETEPCSSSCDLMPLFMVLLFLAMFLLFACSSMNITATVRCVPASQRSLAIGIQWILLRLLGTIPGPVSFGAAFDGACSLWQEDCDGSRGQCLFYDLENLALNIFLISACVKAGSLIFIFLAWKLYKPPRQGSIKGEFDRQEITIKPDSDQNQNGSIHKESSGNVQTEMNGGIVSPVFEDNEHLNTQIGHANAKIFTVESMNDDLAHNTQL